MDRQWWKEYGGSISGDFELWTTNREAARIFNLNFIHGEQGAGIAQTDNTIKMGGHSGYQAVGLALHFGAEKVILVGYDMQLTGGQTHWHGDHKRLGNPLAGKMKDWINRYRVLANQAPGKIVNCTRQTALTCFPRTDLETCLAES